MLARDSVLHFPELDDAALRKRCGAAAFWATELEFGSGPTTGNLFTALDSVYYVL